ncbi:uncharacterized protein LOC115884528 [Sitophilus oryzae]|nr:uncharacterized protein LOC115884528 [Sitophilus oryzae]
MHPLGTAVDSSSGQNTSPLPPVIVMEQGMQPSGTAFASSSSQTTPRLPPVIVLEQDKPCVSTSMRKVSPVSSQGIKRLGKTIPREEIKNKQITELTEARLALIKKEEQQMDELHKIRLEEAIYRKEAARLQMLQEELKLKQLQNEN